ncbi:MAG: ribosomal protein S18-alanine N-acetyltransferase [Hyphomicrobium sp.]
MTAGIQTPLDARYVSLLWAGPDRAAEIAALHARLFDPAWDAASVAATLEHPGSTALIALVGQPKQFAGFILGQIAADEAEILSVGVAPELQRRGLGRRLVEGLMRAVKRAESRRLFLEVAADNEAAYALYRGLGFKPVGARKDYYERPGGAKADALNLALAL